MYKYKWQVLEKCSTSFTVREMQNKSTMKYYTPISMTKIKKAGNSKQSNLKAYILLMACKIVEPTWKIKSKTYIYPEILLSGKLEK